MASVSSRASSPMFPMSTADTEGSTPASSPPPPSSDPAEKPQDAEEEEDEEDEEMSERLKTLKNILEKSTLFVEVLKQQMDRVKLNGTRRTIQTKTTSKKREVASADHTSQKAGTKKRLRADAQDSKAHAPKRVKMVGEEQAADAKEAVAENATPFEQPALVTGATLKDYQLEGVAWMAALHQSGLSGILADEMGLGKTLQTIAFHAFLRERSSLPFLVLCPLSVLDNWVEEFKRFAPDIPVVMYHGTPVERAEIRQKKMVFSEADMEAQNRAKGIPPAASSSSSKEKSKAGKSKAAAKNDRSRAHPNQHGVSKATALQSLQRTNFPVVITTYEMLMRDRAYLAEYHWGFIVVDEGHRLKNMKCRLLRELRMIPSSSRMILTGTPLQNNLSELFTLLNFVLPEMFKDPVELEDWFNFPQLQTNISSSRSAQIIRSLHSILRPFLLRRLKVDVEANLPPKKEYVLYAPLSERQREVYDAIASGSLRALLVKEANENQGRAESDEEEETPLQAQAKAKKGRAGLRRTKRKSYAVDGNDDEYFRRLEAGEIEDIRRRESEKSHEELAREYHRKAILSKVNGMSLQNMVMQLRKVCSHPFLFDWPIDPKTRQPVINDELSTASGKMMVLERLLDELFTRGHKVLLFSQFTTMLDIIEDWATEYKGWSLCRIDGSTSMADRREEVNRFQKSGDAEDAPRLFLLSTRAGGLGLNLVAADTVIFYDQDWNPQVDLQAQDRAHRIGQTRPVLVFRIVSKHTVETKIMQRANDKRKLETLVIARGEFKDPTLAPSRNRKETMAEMAAALLKLEGEQIEVVPSTAAGKASVISDEDLDVLLDRSPEVFTERGRGWTSTGAAKDEKKGVEKKAAFAVYEAPATKGGDFLAEMMAEGEEE
ncbi:hypothetical protein EVJ58_g2214 [Rhodofomes roseus]|uniref:Helicase-like protein n=1 Tax=Rhodofomes roseus TaxID=34475 RepID=A0A4Y9YVA8_9APHY|nr:hypothetical protein EVJ58_g2214 [Rhodofomes roseus]